MLGAVGDGLAGQFCYVVSLMVFVKKSGENARGILRFVGGIQAMGWGDLSFFTIGSLKTGE